MIYNTLVTSIQITFLVWTEFFYYKCSCIIKNVWNKYENISALEMRNSKETVIWCPGFSYMYKINSKEKKST